MLKNFCELYFNRDSKKFLNVFFFKRKYYNKLINHIKEFLQYHSINLYNCQSLMIPTILAKVSVIHDPADSIELVKRWIVESSCLVSHTILYSRRKKIEVYIFSTQLSVTCISAWLHNVISARSSSRYRYVYPVSFECSHVMYRYKICNHNSFLQVLFKNDIVRN